MRPCVKCGAAIGNADATCTECGAPQLPSVEVNPDIPSGEPADDDMSSNEYAWVELSKLAAVLCLIGFPVATYLLFGPTCVAVSMVFVLLASFVVLAILGGVGG